MRATLFAVCACVLVAGCTKPLTDPCTGQKFKPSASPRAEADKQAFVRAQLAEGGNFAQSSCPSSEYLAALSAAKARQGNPSVDRPYGPPSRADKKAYDALRAKGYSPAEAERAAPSIRKLCETSGGRDCR